MEQQYTTINRKDNKLLYVLDTGLDKFVIFVIILVRQFVPKRLKGQFDSLCKHKEMLHNVVGLAFFNALGGLCVMTTQIKLANYLGASVYGVYAYCLAIGEVGSVFVRYGRNKTMVRDLIQYPKKRDALVVSTFFLSIINLILFLIMVFACHKPLEIEKSWTYFLLIMTPCLASLTLGPLYESLSMMSWSSIYAFLQKVVFLTAIWILFFTQVHVSLLTIGTIVLASWIIVYIVEYHEIITQLHINFFRKVDIKDIWNLYKENFIIFLSCVTGVAFGPLMQMILNNYADSKSVGIYAAGLQIYYICIFFNTQVGRVGNPMMAQACKSNVSLVERRQLVWRYTTIMMLTAIPFALPMLLCPQFLTDLIYTAEYESLSKYLPIFSVYLVAISLGVVFTQFLISMRKDREYFTIYISSAVATIILAYLLIPKYSVLGAVLSLCVPHSIGCALYFLFSIKYLK